ncbi:MAG TPA: hypothetical protein VHI99_27760 [Vicinamibacterales bacterium]|jgi:hypothetical protein|nr:hypothetical protein [Vicinamibacterales bacterium]
MPCGLFVALALVAAPRFQTAPDEQIKLELRLFNGSEEVTAHSRVTVQRAGERGEPLAQVQSGASRVEVTVPAGFYDVQAIHERDGRVLHIKWAQRLVVMPYPDEAGRHLEVVNFQNGFGAIEIRGREKGPVDVSIYRTGDHVKEAALRVAGDDYVLFVLPAGEYDLQVMGSRGATWHTRIEVPLDRTRLWIVP